ncbi:lipoprotein [Streptomyces sp. MUSC 125]|nr:MULTISPECIES: cysteine/serine endopeptidase inhibitor [Streptomyces]KIE27685.1 lipoprotein [Streptomyces sp. MUSC 125]
MKAIKRARLWFAAGAVAMTMAALGTDQAYAAVPIGQPVSGTATWYNDAGYGACGTPIDASSQILVAVSPSYWTSANPNLDPLCSGISVQVSYNGRTITVPVRDKCWSCAPGHIDLSAPAFRSLAAPDLGVIPVTWKFVRS